MTGEVLLGFAFSVIFGLNAISKFKKRKRLLLSELHMWSIGMGFGFAPIIAFFSGSDELLPIEDVYPAYLSVFLYCTGVFLSSLIIRYLNKNLYTRLLNSSTKVFSIVKHIISKRNAFASLIIIITIRIYAFTKGTGISGISTLEKNLSMSYPVVILDQVLSQALLVLLSIVAVIWFLDKRNILLVALISLTLFITSFITGRRQFLYLLVTVLIALKLYFGRVNFRKLLYLFLSFFLVLFLLSPIILSFRVGVQNEVLGKDTDVFKASSESLFSVVDSLNKSSSEIFLEGKDNMKKRPLGCRMFLLSIIEAQKSKKLLLGDAFLQEQEGALPRFLRKSPILLNSKHYVQLRYGMPIIDANHTLVSSSVADFGILGSLPYGILMGLYFDIIILVTSKYSNNLPFFFLFTYSQLLFIAIDFETNPGFQLPLIRNILIVFVIVKIIKYLNELIIRRYKRQVSKVIGYQKSSRSIDI